MPTVFTHALIGWGVSRAFPRRGPTQLMRRRDLLAAGLAVVPDLDVVAFSLGIPYQHQLGHRGLSHSLCCAVVLAAVAWCGLRWGKGHNLEDGSELGPPRGWLDFFVLACATMTHGVLDMATNGGLGVAIWSPISAERFFWPTTPIPVSPIGLGSFLRYGLPVLLWEVALLWPLAILTIAHRTSWQPRWRAISWLVLGCLSLWAWSVRLAV